MAEELAASSATAATPLRQAACERPRKTAVGNGGGHRAGVGNGCDAADDSGAAMADALGGLRSVGSGRERPTEEVGSSDGQRGTGGSGETAVAGAMDAMDADVSAETAARAGVQGKRRAMFAADFEHGGASGEATAGRKKAKRSKRATQGERQTAAKRRAAVDGERREQAGASDAG